MRLKYTFKNRSFLALVSANFMGILIQSLIIGSLFYLADYVVQEYSTIVLIFVFLPLLVGYLDYSKIN